MKRNSLLNLTKQVSSLLNCGLNIQQAMEIEQSLLKVKKEKVFCNYVYSQLVIGKNLSEALYSSKEKLPLIYLPLVKIGEESGNLPQIFVKLSEYLEEKQLTHQKLMQAMFYPSLVLVTCLILIFTILIFVFPKFKMVFESFQESSTKVAQLSKSLQSFVLGFFIFLCLLVFIIVLISCIKTFSHKAKFYFSKIEIRIPFVNNYLINKNLKDFCFSVSLLIDAGISIQSGMKQSVKVMENLFVQHSMINVLKKVEQGQSLSSCLKLEKVFPEFFISWILIGENTGNTNRTFSELYKYYKNEQSKVNETFSQTIEPIFILLIGVFVLILVTKFIVPFFSLLGEL